MHPPNTTFTLSTYTSLDDVSGWVIDPGNLTFNVNKDASFQLFAESAAVAAIKAIRDQGRQIRVDLSVETIRSVDELIDKRHELPEILFSLFGLQLLHCAEQVTLFPNCASTNLRKALGSIVWSTYRQNAGCHQSGKVSYFASRHGYQVPKCLQESGASSRFPRFNVFADKIGKRFASMLGTTASDSPTEKTLIEWLFHIAENAFEHGAWTEDNGQRREIRGYKGYSFGKVVLSSERELNARHDLPKVVSNYLLEGLRHGTTTSRRTFQYASITDLGPGIQNTLSRDASESDIDVINRSLIDGESRKNISDDETAGFGFGHAMAAARQLNALLYLVSCDVVAYYDFSDQPEKQNPTQALELITLPPCKNTVGCSVSLIWPAKPDHDQITLL